jgi:hypothetical protein
VVQQHVTLLERGEHIGGLGCFHLSEVRMSRRKERRVLELGTDPYRLGRTARRDPADPGTWKDLTLTDVELH